MDQLDELWIVRQVRTTKARFVRAADTGALNLLRDTLTADVVIDFTEAARDEKTGFSLPSPATEQPLRGREAAVAQMGGVLRDMVSIHHVGEPEIEVIDLEHARAIWPVADRLFLPAGHPLAELAGYGHYHETYRVEDGVWRIAALKLTRLRFYGVPAPAAEV